MSCANGTPNHEFRGRSGGYRGKRRSAGRWRDRGPGDESHALGWNGSEPPQRGSPDVSPRRNRIKSAADRETAEPAAPLGGSLRRTDSYQGDDWVVQTVAGTPGRFYRCPGCDQEIPRVSAMWWPGRCTAPGWTTGGTGTARAGAPASAGPPTSSAAAAPPVLRDAACHPARVRRRASSGRARRRPARPASRPGRSRTRPRGRTAGRAARTPGASASPRSPGSSGPAS